MIDKKPSFVKTLFHSFPKFLRYKRKCTVIAPFRSMRKTAHSASKGAKSAFFRPRAFSSLLKGRFRLRKVRVRLRHALAAVNERVLAVIHIVALAHAHVFKAQGLV